MKISAVSQFPCKNYSPRGVADRLVWREYFSFILRRGGRPAVSVRHEEKSIFVLGGPEKDAKISNTRFVITLKSTGEKYMTMHVPTLVCPTP